MDAVEHEAALSTNSGHSLRCSYLEEKHFLKKSGKDPQLVRPRRMGTGRAHVHRVGRMEGV